VTKVGERGSSIDYFVSEKPCLQSKSTLLKSKFFPARQNSLFQKTKEKFGGKKITLEENEVFL
jgi:hypothetical protein